MRKLTNHRNSDTPEQPGLGTVPSVPAVQWFRGAWEKAVREWAAEIERNLYEGPSPAFIKMSPQVHRMLFPLDGHFPASEVAHRVREWLRNNRGMS
jgi:hypothetical protein